jgi:hypothetical protein
MGGEALRVSSLPLLPAGESLFSNLPARAIVLDELAPALRDGVITVTDGDNVAVLVVREGAVADAVSAVNGLRTTGAATMALLRGWESASMSCSRLSVEAMSLLGPLLHGEPVYSDLRLEWTAWSRLLDDLRGRGQTFVVELQTPIERGVTVIRCGEQIATFSQSQLALGEPAVLDALAEGGEGTIRVLAVREPQSDGDLPATVPDGASQAATHSAPPLSTRVGVTPALAPTGYDDANATFSSLFGVLHETQPLAPTIALEPPRHLVTDDVVSLVPAFKLLAQRRLQRSSTPVEDVVDRAVSEHQSVEWLVSSVRMMRVRGFVSDTLERLADEIQALARNR